VERGRDNAISGFFMFMVYARALSKDVKIS